MNGEVQDFILPLAEPNRMSDVYRNLQPMSIPLQIEKHLNFVDISEDGCMLLGSSTLNGRYWTGSVHYFNEPTVLRNCSNEVNHPEFDYNNKCLTGMNSTTVTTAGKFIDSKEKVVIGEDSGAVSILALTDVADEDGSKSTHIVVNLVTYDHDDSVLSLSVSPDSKNIISGSMDRSIKVWSTDKLISQYSFRPAHTHHVTDVQYSSNSNDIFASCSLDGYALMWDTRLDKPAKVIKEGDGEGLTCVAWYPDNSCDNIFATGTNFGNVILYDVRMPFKSLTNVKVFSRPLHKLAFNSNGILAACGDTCEVKILDCYEGSSLNVIYSDKRHKGFVRGLSWHPNSRNQLYSCGWDTQVLLHNLDNKNQYNLGVENIDLNS